MIGTSNYFAVLPSAVRYNPKLTARAVLLYALLTSLAASNGEIYAANDYLMRTLGTSERTVMRLLAQLSEEKYISIRYEYRGETKEIARRFIDVNPLPLLLELPKTQALYAVIPSHILSMSELSVQAKLLYAEISAATPTDGYCGKPATFFAELLSVSTSTVRRLIKALADADALRVEMEYKDNSREIAHRRIYLTEAAAIVEKRRQIATDEAKTVSSDKLSCADGVANTPDSGQIRGMLVFDTTSEITDKVPCKRRKIHRRRKKATEKLRL